MVRIPVRVGPHPPEPARRPPSAPASTPVPARRGPTGSHRHRRALVCGHLHVRLPCAPSTVRATEALLTMVGIAPRVGPYPSGPARRPSAAPAAAPVPTRKAPSRSHGLRMRTRLEHAPNLPKGHARREHKSCRYTYRHCLLFEGANRGRDWSCRVASTIRSGSSNVDTAVLDRRTRVVGQGQFCGRQDRAAMSPAVGSMPKLRMKMSIVS